uniref:Uncharacterized protein n=1 Tax=Oryza glumipatula TaxID=40148 RepID=A0A0D9YV33_9ORYZ
MAMRAPTAAGLTGLRAYADMPAHLGIGCFYASRRALAVGTMVASSCVGPSHFEGINNDTPQVMDSFSLPLHVAYKSDAAAPHSTHSPHFHCSSPLLYSLC